MNQDFIDAIDELVEDRGIDRDILIDTIEQALLTAYKKNFGYAQNVRVEMDALNGEIKVYSQREVVEDEEIYDSFLEIELSDARKISPNYNIGDIVEHEVTPRDFGRIAAQTAKQVVVQRIREAERELTFEEFTKKADEIETGEISRINTKDNKVTVYGRIGRGEGIMLPNEQIPGEEYRVGKKMKFYIVEVKRTNRSPQIIISRSHPGLVRRLFEAEVPEIKDGIVKVKSIAREAGSRTKIAVESVDEKIDPIGACVGPAGLRVKNIVDELGDEKIDIIKYSDDPVEFISASLSPAKVEKVILNETAKSCVVVVPDGQLSLAIGKEGQNARLAAKLSGWKIDIKSELNFDPERDDPNLINDEEENADAEETENTEAAEAVETAEEAVKAEDVQPVQEDEEADEFSSLDFDEAPEDLSDEDEEDLYEDDLDKLANEVEKLESSSDLDDYDI